VKHPRLFHGGYVLGREDFRQQIEKMLKRRVERGNPGRPAKRDLNTANQQQLEI